MQHENQTSVSRRDFLKTSGTLAAGAVLSAGLTPRVHAAENNTIKVALIGCGGRGRGAAINALNTNNQGPVKIWALADTFQDQVDRTEKALKDRDEEHVEIGDRKFAGFDSYKQATDAVGPGGVVLLCSPPAFRPSHTEYAVNKGAHVFMEKSFCIDGPGYRKMKEVGEKATQKNLKVAGGLMTRHSPSVEECIKRIHDGEIGDIITNWVYRVEGHHFHCGPIGEGMTPLQHQLRNFNCFTWLCGSFALDWMIHNLDISCWSRDAWPVSCQGQGGRQVRTIKDQMFDHCAFEYSFANGGHMMVQLRQQPNTWTFFGAVVQGTKGTAVLGEGQHFSRILKGQQWKEGRFKKEDVLWQYSGKNFDQYQIEHDRLFAAIRADKPYNETARCINAAMVGILGRMATESGKEIFWNDVVNSDVELTPNLDKLDINGPSPVMPDANGDYEIAKPGITPPR